MSESPSTGWNRPSSGPGRNRRACERVLDDWVGRLQVYVPSGYKLSLPATGSIAVQAIETQIGPSNIGKLTGALKTAPAGDATVAWASANCDTGAHVAVWSVAVAGNDDSWILQAADASVEAQSIVYFATGVLTIAAKKAGAKVLLTGKLAVGGEAMDGVAVKVTHGVTTARLITLGSAKTNAAGAYSLRTPLRSFRYFQAGATVGGGDLGAAGCKASFGVPCLDATTGGLAFSSRIIHVR